MAKPTVIPTTQPTRMNTATARPTHTSIPATPTPALGIGSTMVSPKDGMVMMYVPEGEFSMGTNYYDNAAPVHTVYFDAYWIDQTEVTNSMYEKCVSEGACKELWSNSSYTRALYYGNLTFDDYPVINVDWFQAQEYCHWAGRELPTEAQWEKAARGIDGRYFPWGNQQDIAILANCDVGFYGDTKAVGSYPQGASPYGALDMAGNVWEWVLDWYGPYSSGKVSNPQGPSTGQNRIVRGGSWTYDFYESRSDFRTPINPYYNGSSRWDYGIRCSQSASVSP